MMQYSHCVLRWMYVQYACTCMYSTVILWHHQGVPTYSVHTVDCYRLFLCTLWRNIVSEVLNCGSAGIVGASGGGWLACVCAFLLRKVPLLNYRLTYSYHHCS